jgi:hypothetical protein
MSTVLPSAVRRRIVALLVLFVVGASVVTSDSQAAQDGWDLAATG